MIILPTEAELEELRKTRSEGCISIYVPFTATEMSGSPNRITLKNMFKDARKLLEARGIPSQTIEAILAGPGELLQSRSFWQLPHQALALFANKDFVRYYYLPDDGIVQKLHVGGRFELKQLTASVKADTVYYVLRLSHNGSHLYRCTRTSSEEISLKDAAGPMAQVLRIDEYSQSRELHPIAPASAGKNSEGYHQQYGSEDTDKQMLSDYFRLVDKQIKTLATNHHPLILAGVEYLIAIYRKVSSYPDLLPRNVVGNYDNVPVSELHTKAWDVARQELLRPTRREVLPPK